LASQKFLDATVIVAVSNNGVIGRANQLPWHLRSDLQRFKRLTMGHGLIMGRKTFESIGRVLPGRVSIVITRNSLLDIPGVETASSLDEAISKMPDGKHAYIIGGGEIFREALPRVRRIMLTRVLADIDGDAQLDDWDRGGWRLTHSESIPAGESDEWPTEFEIWERG
jgi:dihydrofolate reductase